MFNAKRFGQKVRLPSTLEIRQDFADFLKLEAGRERLAVADGLPASASWQDIGLNRAALERKAAG